VEEADWPEALLWASSFVVPRHKTRKESAAEPYGYATFVLILTPFPARMAEN
jgi:hypothetical protein